MPTAGHLLRGVYCEVPTRGTSTTDTTQHYLDLISQQMKPTLLLNRSLDMIQIVQYAVACDKR